MKILVFCPTYANAMQPQTTDCLNALASDRAELVKIIGHDNPFPGETHQNTLHQYQVARRLALGGKYDALLTIEHDMVFPADAFDVLDVLNVPIAYGLYVLRHGSNVVNALEWYGPTSRNLGESLTLKPHLYAQGVKDGVIRVSGVGFGVTLIRADVLEKIEMKPSGDAYAPDWAFAEDANRAGITQVCSFSLRCGHIEGSEVLWPPS